MRALTMMRGLRGCFMVVLACATCVAYAAACDDSSAPDATQGDAAPAQDAASGVDSQPTSDAGVDACTPAQKQADIDGCFLYATVMSTAAMPVTTACLPPALADERAKGGAITPGNWVLKQAYDLSADCTTPRTLRELANFDGLWWNIATEWTARPDKAVGKTSATFLNPPMMPDPDAAPPPPRPTFLGRACPATKFPEVDCIQIRPWFDSGFYTIKNDELRLFKNAEPIKLPDGGVTDDVASAKLYAVYQKQ